MKTLPCALISESRAASGVAPSRLEPVKIQVGGGVGRKAGLKTVYIGKIVDWQKVLQHFSGTSADPRSPSETRRCRCALEQGAMRYFGCRRRRGKGCRLMSNRMQAASGLVAGPVVRPVIPTDFDQAARVAKTAVQAGLFQAESEEKALAQATMAVLQGLELGIPPMQAVQQIAIIGGRCTIWGDLIPALIWRAGHRIREWIEGEGDGRVAWCEITRVDNKEVIKRKFSVDDAKRAGLWDKRAKIKRKDNADAWHEEDNDNPWYRYEERMLQMRARGFCARDGVPDVLHGLYIREEIEDEGERPFE